MDSINDVTQLEDLLSAPPPALVADLAGTPGDIVVLGAAGKMGPTLSRMARRALDAAGSRDRVFAVSRFSNPAERDGLLRRGVQTIQADLLDPDRLHALPEAPNVIYMAGMKFGATGNEPLTWAMNALLPGLVARKYARSRIVAFSTGNIYGLTPVARGGSVETDPPNPVGEYAMSCLGRERIFQHAAQSGTPTLLFRLNYACELRYGVLVDLAQRILAGDEIDLSMGWFNVIWQADANAIALRALAHAGCPARALNVTGMEVLRVREVSEWLGQLLGREPQFVGRESGDALLSNAGRAQALFGRPSVSAGQLMQWIADWLKAGRPTLNKPTHFEARDGKF